MKLIYSLGIRGKPASDEKRVMLICDCEGA